MTEFDDIELAGLTDAELAELSEFIDPDNELLPASERIPAHTKKKPTGPFDRKRLLTHLAEQAEKSTVGQDYVPFVKKEKKEKKDKAEKQKATAAAARKAVESEFDDMLGMLDDDDLQELAAELGMHSMLNQAQSRGDEKPKANFSTSYRLPPGRFEEDDPQDTDIEDVIQRLKDDDCTLTEVNLNNHGGLDAELKAELFEALVDNTYLEVLQMCNVKLDEGEAAELGRVLKMNCTLRVLSLESNRITRKGIKALMRCLSENPDTSIKELRLANQYFAGGAGAEGEIAKYLDKIKTITKLGYNFTVPSFRSKVDGLILRNLDYDRKRRAAMAD